MEFHVEKTDYLGRGIAKQDGKVCFINKAFANEVVECNKIKENKHFDLWEVTDVKKKSPIRIPSFCPYSKECGGCSFDVCSYLDGLKLKEEGIKDLAERKRISLPDFKIVPSPNPLGYRNKISLKVVERELGFFKENTHEFVPVKTCPLAQKSIQNVMNDFNLFPFQNGTVTIRSNENDELLLILDTNENVNFSKTLVQNHKIAGIIQNGKCLYNDSFLYERREGILYKVSYDAFFQVNPYVSEILTKELMNFISPSDIILDLYCGVGYLTLKMARKSKSVTGIEVVPNAIYNAYKNKELNHMENVSFHLGKVENIIDKLPQKFTKVVLDPPRTGLDKKTLQFLFKEEIPEIIYISCNPITMMRDLEQLTQKYDIIFSRGYDMFSYTKHVECCSLLSLKKDPKLK